MCKTVYVANCQGCLIKSRGKCKEWLEVKLQVWKRAWKQDQSGTYAAFRGIQCKQYQFDEVKLDTFEDKAAQDILTRELNLKAEECAESIAIMLDRKENG